MYEIKITKKNEKECWEEYLPGNPRFETEEDALAFASEWAELHREAREADEADVVYSTEKVETNHRPYMLIAAYEDGKITTKRFRDITGAHRKMREEVISHADNVLSGDEEREIRVAFPEQRFGIYGDNENVCIEDNEATIFDGVNHENFAWRIVDLRKEEDV